MARLTSSSSRRTGVPAPQLLAALLPRARPAPGSLGRCFQRQRRRVFSSARALATLPLRGLHHLNGSPRSRLLRSSVQLVLKKIRLDNVSAKERAAALQEVRANGSHELTFCAGRGDAVFATFSVTACIICIAKGPMRPPLPRCFVL